MYKLKIHVLLALKGKHNYLALGTDHNSYSFLGSLFQLFQHSRVTFSHTNAWYNEYEWINSEVFYSDFKPLSKKFWFRDMFNRYNIPLQKEAFRILFEKILVVSLVMYCGYRYFPYIFNPLTMFSHVIGLSSWKCRTKFLINFLTFPAIIDDISTSKRIL